MFNLFKKNTSFKEIQQWSEKISVLIEENYELKEKIDQIGIIDGAQTISEFLRNNEYGLAYEHLIYMIDESGVNLEKEQLEKISQLANKVGKKPPYLFSPTLIEIEEFYNILNQFNQAQLKVRNHLANIWNMQIPLSCDKWIIWSQEQYGKDKFENKLGLKIYPHGYGLSYQDAEVYIDFDFGAQGEINGFDINRLWLFINKNEIKTLFTSENQIKKVVDFELSSEKLIFSGYINYYKK